MKSNIFKLNTMKKIIVLLLLAIPIISLAQEKASWDFPMKPGSEEWKALSSNEEKISACQIPYKQLSSIATFELIQVCLNYPLLPDVFAFNNAKDGFVKYETDFNQENSSRLCLGV